MTHLAGKWYWQKKKTQIYFDFENFENDDVIAAVLAFRLLKKILKKQRTLNAAPFLFTNKQAVLLPAQSDQSQFSFPAGFWPEMERSIRSQFLAPEKSGTRKVWQTDQFLVPETGVWNWPVCHHYKASNSSLNNIVSKLLHRTRVVQQFSQ